MAAYLIADIEITDPEKYEEYKRRVPSTLEKFGARYLARGGACEVLEGEWQAHRVVVLEFPSMQALKAWYEAPEYAPLLAIRQAASTARFIAVEGC